MKHLSLLAFSIWSIFGTINFSWGNTLDGPITIGASPYGFITSTFTVLGSENSNRVSLSFKAKHSLERISDRFKFTLSFLGCGKVDISIGQPSISEKFVNLCDLLRETNIVTVYSTDGNRINHHLSNQSFGNFDLAMEYEEDKATSRGIINFFGIPELKQFKEFTFSYSLKDMSADFSLKRNQQPDISGRIQISNDNIIINQNGIRSIRRLDEFPDKSLASRIKNFPDYHKAYIGSNRHLLYFGGMTVRKGEILKKSYLSAYGKIHSNILSGFITKGEGVHNGREIIVLEPVLGDDMKKLFSGLQRPGFQLDVDDILLFIDKELGIPTYFRFITDLSEKNIKTGRIEVSMDTVLHSTDNRSKSLADAKKECALIGFKKGTEKFGLCVMKLID